MNVVDTWEDAYDRWLADCLVVWNTKYAANRILGSDGPNCIEFGADGTAYPHGIGGTSYVRAAVPRWDESKYFVRAR